MFDDLKFATDLWKRLAPYVPQTIKIPISIYSDLIENWSPIGLNERFRFYRYSGNQKFAPHYDGTYQRSQDEASQVTFMVYLNQEFTGGETKFYLNHPYGEIAIKPQAGMALCFLHNLRHEGTTVKEGTKYVLRTDIMYRRTIVRQQSSIFS